MRWTKSLREIGAETGRALIMIAAVSFALFAIRIRSRVRALP